MLTTSTTGLIVQHVMSKERLTIKIDPALILEMKHQALREKRAVGTITEELYREYLKKVKSKK